MEEIEKLRAKAIASIPVPTNPRSSSTAAAISGGSCGGGKFKYPKTREEGEVSSGEDVELATCSVAPTNSANLGEFVPSTSRNDAINASKNALASRSSTPGIQLRPSVMQNYQKHYHKPFKRKLPFRSRSSQALHWHAKDSNNNLVISFSDDDSESETDERYPEKDIKRKDGTSMARDSRLAATLLPKPTDGIGETDGSKQMENKGFAYDETISSVDHAYETSCGPQGPSAENGSHINRENPANKTSATRELGHLLDSTMTDQRLELLRHQIADRENKLMAHNRSVVQKGATVGSDSNQNCLHAMKPEAQATGIIRRHAYDANLELEVNESAGKRLKHDKSSSVFDFDVPSKAENDRTFHVDNHCTHHQVDSNNKSSAVINSKDSFLALSAANLQDESLSKNVDVGKNGRSEKFSEKAGVSNLPSNYVSSTHIIKGNQQITPTTDVLIPLKTSSIYKKFSDLGRSVNKEANTTEEGSMSFHSLLKMEELHDKELEEAQEYRYKCELDERHALKAYRKAQRSLAEANERCTILYARRELFSAKVRAFAMKASNSICTSDWLCQQIPHEDQFYEPDASTSVHRDNGPLDGAVVPTHNPNISMDDDGGDIPSSKRVVESRSDHADVQIEKAPSRDTSQDYELLEASLRSELVARLGLRASSKMNDTNRRELDVENGVTGDMEPSQDMERSLLPHDMMPISDEKQPAKLDGIERTQERSCLLGAPPDFKSLANATSNEELHSIADLNDSFAENSGSSINTAVFSLPTSGLHSVCRHTFMIFPGYHNNTFSMRENDYTVTSKEMTVTDFISDNIGEFLNFKRSAPMRYRGIYEGSVEIDPFWPLCMFEFRGKCNDEQCPWQHMKAGKFPKLQDDEHSNCHTTCLPNGKLGATRFPCSALLHVLPIPTYQIGPYLIKADSHQSQSVLARSNWQYQQRGFCASFLIPFSVQRILPLDAPCLQLGDDPVADDYSWNRLSLYYWSQDDTLSFKEQIKQGPVDVEQLLEMALDQFGGELCEPDRRKALSLLSHAIESYPSSVILWAVFLYIYYKKEKAIGKDDLFLHAVRHNKGSYELWLLYINSRILCEDRLNAYDRALYVLCDIGVRDGSNHLSPYILDIFLQMIDFLCMCEQVDKVISRICGLLPSNEFHECSGNLLRDICSCLILPDRCLFWTCCAYFVVYEKLPEATMKQFEFAKNLPFGLDWPSAAQLASDRKSLALEIMQLAMTEIASYLDDNPNETDQASSHSLHFLAVSHVKCGAALLGFPGYTELLDKYLKLYPSCMELVLMALRSKQNYPTDLEFSAFEEALYRWPKETPGIQCLWNQYAEYALTNNRIDLAERLIARWYQDFPKFRDLSSFCSITAQNSFDSSSHINSTVQFKTKDDAFGFLNLFLHCLLHKRVADARRAIDKSLELAAPEDYDHFVKEQALFMGASNSTESQKHFSVRSLSSLLNLYLADPRSNLHLEPLSRKFIRTIKKPRIQQMVNGILGPVSRTSTLVNSVLKVCYGPTLLPEKFNGIKETVSFVEFLMEITPANYELALSAYRICSRSSIPTRTDCNSLKFWACSLLINSIFQAIPVAPEHIWLEAAKVLGNSESLDITLRFHKQAVSVYPFSVRLWQSYANLYAAAGDASEIVEAAQERGIELNNILNQL